ncbi:unnamed protein product, partial [Prorocentrum cordatum]
MRYAFRQVKKKEQREQLNRNAEEGIQRRPCVVIGHQGENTWVSLGGRTMRVAPVHIKALARDDVWFPNGKGEIGQAVAELNEARVSLEQEEAPVEDIRPEPGEPKTKPDEMKQAWREFIDKPNDDDLRLDFQEDPQPEQSVEDQPTEPPPTDMDEQRYGAAESRRRRAAVDGADSCDFGPAFNRLQTSREQASSAAASPRAASSDPEAAPSGSEPAEPKSEGARQSSRSAPKVAMQTSIDADRIKRKQAEKETHWGAIKESEAARGKVKANLSLPGRFVYLGKTAPLRTDKHPLPVRFGLEIYAAEVEAAFMQGDEQPDQELFMAQPREGLPGLRPKQMINLIKRLKRTSLVAEEKIRYNIMFSLRQHSLDPVPHHGYDKHGELRAVVVVQVDDLLLGISPSTLLCTTVSASFCRGRLERFAFTFCGKQAWRDEEGVIHLRQTEYANICEGIALNKERKMELKAEATPTEFSESRSEL